MYIYFSKRFSKKMFSQFSRKTSKNTKSALKKIDLIPPKYQLKQLVDGEQPENNKLFTTLENLIMRRKTCPLIIILNVKKMHYNNSFFFQIKKNSFIDFTKMFVLYVFQIKKLSQANVIFTTSSSAHVQKKRNSAHHGEYHDLFLSTDL